MKRLPAALAAAACAASLAAPSWSQSVLPPAWERLKLSDSVTALKLGGDLRLRNENFKRRGAGTTDRARLRYRLRYGLEASHPHDLTTVFRMASGTGEQTSTNQSFDNLSGQKALWVDLVFLRWAPAVHENGRVSVQAGRQVNPLWRVYSSDLVWDDDFNPEGFGQKVEWVFGEQGLSLFANGLQTVTDEDSSRGKNQWLFSTQAGFEKTLPMESRVRLAAAYHKWSDENQSTFGQAAGGAITQDGNRRFANNTLVSRFRVGELTGQLSSWVGSLPVALQATLIRNWGVKDNALVQGPVGRDGYQFGLIVGAAKKAGQWEAAYFKKYAQVDATVSDVADSDFGDGGLNRVGHIVWAAYNPADWMQLKAKGFVTDTLDRSFPAVAGVKYDPSGTAGAAGTFDKAVNRLQLDVSIKF